MIPHKPKVPTAICINFSSTKQNPKSNIIEITILTHRANIACILTHSNTRSCNQFWKYRISKCSDQT